MRSRTCYIFGSAALMLALSACGQPVPTSGTGASASSSTAASTDHGSMGHGTMTATATATSTAPFDAMFIDGMITHHQGAVDMANQALQQAERPEIKQLAQQIIDSQQAEIAQMQTWRQQWFPDVPPTGGMGMMDHMTVSEDSHKPFDQRFIEAMIPHHQSAIDMARDAESQAKRPEIKQLAGNIITAQEQEIAQMKGWLQQWYGVGMK